MAETESNITKVIPLKKHKSKSDPLRPAKDYLRTNFDFKLNVLTQRVIYSRKDDDKNFHVLTDYLRNTIYLELVGKCKKISFDDFKKLLFSDFVTEINPIKELIIATSKEIDTTKDFINDIASTVKVENAGNWNTYFKKWFVAMIANVFVDTKNTNHTCLVLAGEQGLFKTTWLEALIPSELIEYRYTGQIKVESKDTLKQLATRLLVVIDDQLHKLNQNNQDDLKFLITLNVITWRGLFKEFDYDCPRLASFCGSVNGREFLTDLTGSRRFLSFYVENIDMDGLKSINILNAYGQAFNLYNENFKYWFDSEDIDIINKENEDYTMTPIEQDLIEKNFDLNNSSNEYYNATEIKIILESSSRDRLSTKKIGQIMTKLKIKRESIQISGVGIRKKYGITYLFPSKTQDVF